MKEGNGHVTYTGDFKSPWGIVAKQKGTLKEMRAMVTSFGFSQSYEEALAKVELKLRMDEEFRTKYRGWVFHPILVDRSVRVTETGVVTVEKGERKHVEVR